jgi:hypothetical protein
MTFTFQREFHLWLVDANCPSSDTELEVYESVPHSCLHGLGIFFQRHVLEDNAEMDLEEIG